MLIIASLTLSFQASTESGQGSEVRVKAPSMLMCRCRLTAVGSLARKLSLLVSLFIFDASLVSAQEIALTFDDAPTTQNQYQSGLVRTGMLIDGLKQAGVPQVAFFVVTSRVDSVGKLRLNRYAQAGHIIANHTHSHARISRIGVDAYIQDIFKADAILRGMSGYRSWLRFPFLDEGRTPENRDTIREALAENGYFNGYVTVDNYDWYLDSAFRMAVAAKKTIDFDKLKSIYIDHLWQSIRFYDAIAQATLGRSPRHVLLLHENDLAALYVEDLVGFIRDKGWKIISPIEAYRDPIASTIPDVLLNNQGRVAAIAKARGYSGRLSLESESTQFLDRLFEEQRVFLDP